jgi:hypothetical protein
MSEIAPPIPVSHPWPGVVAKGTFVSLTVTMIGWIIVADYARINGTEHGTPDTRGMIFSAEWAEAFSQAFLIVAPSALAYAALLAAIMACVGQIRSPLYWELAGFAAAAPFLLWAWWVLFQLAAGIPDYIYALFALALLSLFASNTMRRARHGPKPK